MNRIQSDCHDPRLRQLTNKMKFLVVLAIAVACANAEVRSDEAAAPIVRSSFDSSPEGNSFTYGYETGNKIVAQAEGVVKNPNSNEPTLEIKGAYNYVAPDGTPVDISYIANENGYQPQGSHIPVPPAIPEAILRGLAYIESHPPAVDTVRKF